MHLLCIFRQIEHSQVHVSHTLPWLRPVVIDEDVDADLEELDVAVIEEEYGWIDVDADSHVDVVQSCVKVEPGTAGGTNNCTQEQKVVRRFSM